MKDHKRFGMRLRKNPLKAGWNSLNRDTMVRWKPDEEIPLDRIQTATSKLLKSLYPKCEAILASIQKVDAKSDNRDA